MKTLVILLLAISTNVFAEDFFAMKPINFQILKNGVAEKLEEVLKNPEGLLKRFKPEGAKIANKKVSHNVISFQATKTVLFVSHTVNVNGILDTDEDNRNCDKNQKGYKLTLVLDGSDGLVIDNIDRLEAILCTTQVQSNQLTGIAKGIIFKGKDYSNVFGPVARGMIEAQVGPLLKALNEEIQALR
ncbi:MAG: hypothetical protein WC635_11560 [Bacteriovorax sp.]